MSRIQIADLNSSEFSLLHDANDAEMSAIVGGCWWIVDALIWLLF